MSSRKLLVLCGFVIALFAFIFFFERKLPTTAERQQKGDLHWDLPEDRVESVRLVRGAETVELAKSGETWSLVLPERFPADSFAVTDLTSSLADLKNPAGESDAEEGKPADYGLDKPSATATFAWTEPGRGGARQSRTVEFGIDIPGTDLTAARVAGGREIFFVPASVAASVRKPADDFKSREVFPGSIEVTGVDVARGRGRLVLARKDGVWWIEQPIADLADREAAERLSGDLSNLRATEFVAQPADRKALGLDPPVYRVTLTDAKGARHVLDLGSTKSEGDSVYAARDGQVFVVPGSSIDDLSKEAVAFRDKRLVRFERSDVQAVEGTFGSRRLSFRREPAGWSAGGRSILASAADDLLTAVLDAQSEGFLAYAVAGSLAGRPPDATVGIRLSKGPGWTMRFYRNRGELAATLSGRPGAYRVTPATLDALRGAFEKAVAAPAPTPSASPTAGKRKT